MSTLSGQRFSGVLGGSGPSGAWDTILLETEDLVVVPSKGSIVPNWLLVIPKAPSLNFRRWFKTTGNSPDLIKETASLFSGKDLIWFEHGAVEECSSVGCGIDHAHIHLLLDPPFSLEDMLRCAQAMSAGDWHPETLHRTYGGATSSEAYYAVGNLDGAHVLTGTLPSQFFRRVIAELTGTPDQWDYKKHEHLGNVLATLETYSSFADAAE